MGGEAEAHSRIRLIFLPQKSRIVLDDFGLGHAAAPPSSVMNSRRFTDQYLPCFRTKGIAHLGTAALRDFDPDYDRFGSWLCLNVSAHDAGRTS
jgi:hypothetical protein